MKKNAGFTIVEIMVGVVILGIVTLTTNSILVSVFKGTRKAEIIKEVKQNGDYALTVMEVRIREAKQIVSDCDMGGSTSLKIQNIDGTFSNFATSGTQVSQENFETDGITLIDSANLTSSALTIASTLIFICDIQPGKDTKITINFTLQPAVTGAQDAQSTQNFLSVFYMPNY